MFFQIFLSPQVKRSMSIINTHGIFELPHMLANNLRLRILENQEKSGKSQNLLVPSLPAKMKILSILAKNS